LKIDQDESLVLELKVKANTNTKLQKAINQVARYAENINAHKAFVINVTNFHPTNTGFDLTPQEEGNDEDEDSSFMPEVKQDSIPVKVVHLIYTENWLKITEMLHEKKK